MHVKAVKGRVCLLSFVLYWLCKFKCENFVVETRSNLVINVEEIFTRISECFPDVLMKVLAIGEPEKFDKCTTVSL